MSEGEGDSFAALQTRIAAYPKLTRGVYYEVANFVPKLAPWRQEQILAEHEGYPPSARESTYKAAPRGQDLVEHPSAGTQPLIYTP